MDSLSVSVVVPVYNSEGSLEPLTIELAKVLPEFAAHYEVIFVNDGSRDGSWNIIGKLAQAYPWVHGVSFMRNYGQHNATLCGIRRAQYQVVVTMDDDLQHRPEDIPDLVRAIVIDKADVAYGVPDALVHGAARNVASRITKLAMRVAIGVPIATDVSAFRAFRTDIRNAFAGFDNPFVSIDVLLGWGASRYKAVKVRHMSRAIGTSNYSFLRLMRHAINMVTGFSDLPLRIAGIVGFGFTLFGVLILVYVFANYAVYGSAVPGFAFLASITAILSGAQLFAIGIMGEYLARIHVRQIQRPVYVVQTETQTQEISHPDDVKELG